MKAVITFSNNEILTVYEDEVFTTFKKETNDTAKVEKHFGIYRSKDHDLIQGIMDMLIQGDYFFVSSNPSKVYNPNQVVSIESKLE